MGNLIILEKKTPAIITKTNAYCIALLLPTRVIKHKETGVIIREIGSHWEPLSSDGHIVRCHTLHEAQEAAAMCMYGVDIGQFLAISIEPYAPTKDDLPWWQWVRGVRGRQLANLGLHEEDLPESQDAGLEQMSDDEWLTRGPR